MKIKDLDSRSYNPLKEARKNSNTFFQLIESVANKRLTDNTKQQLKELLDSLPENASLADFIEARGKQEVELLVEVQDKLHLTVLRI